MENEQTGCGVQLGFRGFHLLEGIDQLSQRLTNYYRKAKHSIRRSDLKFVSIWMA
jgi:hypothetical protein